MKKIIIILLAVIFLIITLSYWDNDDVIWFNNVEGASYSVKEKEAIANYLLGDKSSLHLISSDREKRIVFLALSNGKNKARVFFGSGEGIVEALDKALLKAPQDAEWFKVDVVSDVRLNASDFEAELPFDRSLYGLAFSKETEAVFTPEELAANTIVGSDNKLRFYNIEDYYEEQGMPYTGLEESNILYYFSTDSFFFERPSEGKPEIVELYRGHPFYNNDINPELLYDSAVAAGDYLKGAVKEDGSFVYIYYPKTDKESNNYNILRHGGTVYSMFELYKKTGDEDLRKQGEKALQYLRDEHIKPCYSAPRGELCVVENDEVKLGGNALAIIAMVEYMEATNDMSYLPVAQKLALRIVSLQRKDGGFKAHKSYHSTGKVSDFISGYYPGEATLALVRLYSLDDNEKWLNTAEDAAKYLIKARDGEKSVKELNHDHWLLYGLNELYRHRPLKIFAEHSFKIVKAIQGMQRVGSPDFKDWLGSYYTPPRSTPAATRTEGLMASYNLAADYGHEADSILKSALLGTAFSLQTQFGPWSAMYVHEPQRVLGGFHKDLSNFSIRIDYVQHNISALLNLWEALD